MCFALNAMKPTLMENRRSYVVAFNRDRDFYEVPAALADAEKLEALVTDIYLPDFLNGGWLSRILGLAHRHCEAIPSSMVKWSFKALWLQMVALRMAKSERRRSAIFNRIDTNLSRMAGGKALRSGAGLFLYSGYALEAFEMVKAADVPRLLFVYHPQGDYVQRILEEDVQRHPEALASHRQHLEDIALNEGRRVANEISRATGLACASSFTAASVRACIGAEHTNVAVIPYGCFPLADGSLEIKKETSPPQILFVGQGAQRKGLHHLLKVWREGFHLVADLTLVLNSVDPGIAAMVKALPSRPRTLEGLSRADLLAEFQRADVFVLPSLVEGFGLVYLEALAAGCHVIGTRNTGLPDLELPNYAATIIDAGDLDALQHALEIAIKCAASGNLEREAIRACATTWTWGRFREGIRQFVCDIENTQTACASL